MNKQVQLFLDAVCSHIKCRAVHKDIREELARHIDDLKQENLKKGMEEEKALKYAIVSMGSSDEIGSRLNDQHKLQTEWLIIALTGILVIFGIVVMYISSNFQNQSISFPKYVGHVVIGIGVMAGLYFFDYTKLKKAAWPLYIGAVLLLLAAQFTGAKLNGVKQWLVFGPFSIPSASFASMMFIVAFTGFLEQYKNGGTAAIIKLLCFAGFSVFLLIAQPSFSTALLLIVTYAMLLCRAVIKNHFGGNEKKQRLILLAGGIITVVMAVVFIDLKGILALRVLSDGSGAGYVNTMADKWLAASRLFGKAGMIYEGTLDTTIPGVTAEYVLINIIANFGWIAGITVILLISIFMIRLFFVTQKIKYDFGFYLSFAACVFLSLQFIISIGINLNLFPVMGVSMPFLSYGGSGYLNSMFFVGIILSVWRRNHIVCQNTDTGKLQRKWFEIMDGKFIIHYKS